MVSAENGAIISSQEEEKACVRLFKERESRTNSSQYGIQNKGMVINAIFGTN